MNNATNKELSFQVLIEGDKVKGDYIAYIPAVRLGVQGESLEEVKANAAELLQMEIESRLLQGKAIPTDDTAHMERISIAIPLQTT